MRKQSKRQSGFFLVEVVVASALIGGVLILLLSLIQDTVEVSQRSLERTQASYLLEEGVEGVKTIRDQNTIDTDKWPSIGGLLNDTTYYLAWNGTIWSLSTTPSKVDAFTRTITFNAVSRNASDDIVTSGGTVDTRTRKVTVLVTWNAPSGVQTESIAFYITDIRT